MSMINYRLNMAEKTELSFWQKVKKGALIGLGIFAGINLTLLLGAPLMAINSLLTFAANGVIYGGMVGAAVGLVDLAAKSLTPQTVKKT